MSPEHFSPHARVASCLHVLELASSDHPDIARQLDGKLKRVQFDTLPEFSESLTTSAAS